MHTFPQYNHFMKRRTLIIGDILALALITLIGFATHGEFSFAFIPRMAVSFIPLCIGWFLLAPSLALFQEPVERTASELWRPPFVMLFAGPLAALVRSIVLGDTVVPSFAVVLTLTAAIALTLWRSIWLWLSRLRS